MWQFFSFSREYGKAPILFSWSIAFIFQLRPKQFYLISHLLCSLKHHLHNDWSLSRLSKGLFTNRRVLIKPTLCTTLCPGDLTCLPDTTCAVCIITRLNLRSQMCVTFICILVRTSRPCSQFQIGLFFALLNYEVGRREVCPGAHMPILPTKFNKFN